MGPIVLRCLVSQFHFSVYNRYGQLVFESFGPGIKWDGKFIGDIQPCQCTVLLILLFRDAPDAKLIADAHSFVTL
jgi:hypothetical protein